MYKKPLWTKDFISISFSSFFLFLVFYMLLTTLPIYTMDVLGQSSDKIGLVVTVFLIAAVLCRPFTGIWLETFGRKKLLYLSIIIFFIASCLYLFTDNFYLLLALRFFHGIGFGMATTVTGTIIADNVPDERRGEGMGYYAMFMSLAMVIGPFLGLTLIDKASFTIIFIICIVSAALATICAFIAKFPDPSDSKITLPKSTSVWKNFFETSTLKIALVAGIVAIAYSTILSFISVYAKELDLIAASGYFFVVYAVVIIASRPFTGKWFDQFGANVIVYPGIILFAVGMFLLSITQSASILLLSGAIIGLGYGTLQPSFQTMAIQVAPPHRRGVATATFFTIFDTGIGLGSFVMGMLASKTDYSMMYFIGAFIVLLTLPSYYLISRKKQPA